MNGRCETNPLDQAVNVCGKCFGDFCDACLVLLKGRKHPTCKECTAIASGVRPGAKPIIRGSRNTAKKRREAYQAIPHETKQFEYFDANRVIEVPVYSEPEEDQSRKQKGKTPRKRAGAASSSKTSSTSSPNSEENPANKPTGQRKKKSSRKKKSAEPVIDTTPELERIANLSSNLTAASKSNDASKTDSPTESSESTLSARSKPAINKLEELQSSVALSPRVSSGRKVPPRERPEFEPFSGDNVLPADSPSGDQIDGSPSSKPEVPAHPETPQTTRPTSRPAVTSKFPQRTSPERGESHLTSEPSDRNSPTNLTPNPKTEPSSPESQGRTRGQALLNQLTNPKMPAPASTPPDPPAFTPAAEVSTPEPQDRTRGQALLYQLTNPKTPAQAGDEQDSHASSDGNSTPQPAIVEKSESAIEHPPPASPQSRRRAGNRPEPKAIPADEANITGAYEERPGQDLTGVTVHDEPSERTSPDETDLSSAVSPWKQTVESSNSASSPWKDLAPSEETELEEPLSSALLSRIGKARSENEDLSLPPMDSLAKVGQASRNTAAGTSSDLSDPSSADQVAPDLADTDENGDWIPPVLRGKLPSRRSED